LYFASLRLVIASSFASLSFEETRPPVPKEFQAISLAADRSGPKA
jgi:hypothetical protein